MVRTKNSVYSFFLDSLKLCNLIPHAGLSRYILDGESALLSAWSYEARRLFRDKLASDEDRHKFDEILSGAIRTDFGQSGGGKAGEEDVFYVTAADASAAPGAPLTK